jgi:hypothetical protein
MADDMERAAQAFDAVIASEPQAPKTNGSGPPERMFGKIGDVEVDEESPAQGGGDDEALYGDRPKKAKEPVADEDDDVESLDEGEPDDEAEAPDEDEDDEAEGPDKEFLSQEVQVIVDGEERVVKLKEALEGYVRTETFHKRMNEVDEAKKIVQRAAVDAVQNYQYTMQIGQEMEAHLDALVPKEPNWDEEFQKNPARARELQKYYEQVKTFRGQLRGRMAEATKKQMESDQAQTAAFAENEAKRFDQINSKHWSTDPKKKGKDLKAMRRTALSEGFSEEEVSQVYDSRMLNILLKASKYDRIMASRPQPVQRVRSKPIAPGTGSAKQRTVQKGTSSAMKRLSKSGSIEDAAVVMDELWKRG